MQGQVQQLASHAAEVSGRLPLTITVAAQHVSTTPKTRFNLPKVSVTHSSKQLAFFLLSEDVWVAAQDGECDSFIVGCVGLFLANDLQTLLQLFDTVTVLGVGRVLHHFLA